MIKKTKWSFRLGIIQVDGNHRTKIDFSGDRRRLGGGYGSDLSTPNYPPTS